MKISYSCWVRCETAKYYNVEGGFTMKRRKLAAVAVTAAMMCGILAGCGGKTEPSKAEDPVKTTEASAGKEAETKEQDLKKEESSGESGKTAEKKEGEKQEIGAVTVYSPAPAEPLEGGISAFTEATGIQVNVVAAGTGELLKRVESEAANPLCDVVWGGGAESMQSYSQYFEPYVSEQDGKIPDTVKDANDCWIGESPVPVVIMYNKDVLDQLGVEIPESWEDLLNPKLKGMISYADPGKSGSAYTLLCTMVTAFGKDDGKGWEFVEELYRNLDGKVQGSSSNSYKLVADGEYAVGLTQEKSVQEYLDAGASNIGYVYPKEGTSAVPDAIAVVKNCPNPEGAKMFVDFILSAEAQQMQADEFNRRPARDDVSAPGTLSDLKDIPLVDYDFEWAGNSKAEILEQWQEIVVNN